MKEKLKKQFPQIAEDIEEYWEDECRNAFLLGCFDRVYGSRHPRRGKFIRVLDSMPDAFTLKHGFKLEDWAQKL